MVDFHFHPDLGLNHDLRMIGGIKDDGNGQWLLRVVGIPQQGESMNGFRLPLHCLGNLTNLGINKLGKVALPVEKTDGDHGNFTVGKALEGITSQHPQPPAVGRYFFRSMKKFLDKSFKGSIHGTGLFQSDELLFNRIIDIRISSNLHGDVGHRIAIGMAEMSPDFIEGGLADAKKSSKGVAGNQWSDAGGSRSGHERK